VSTAGLRNRTAAAEYRLFEIQHVSQVKISALQTASAAMNFLGNVDALIIDLRENGGGSATPTARDAMSESAAAGAGAAEVHLIEGQYSGRLEKGASSDHHAGYFRFGGLACRVHRLRAFGGNHGESSSFSHNCLKTKVGGTAERDL
jgi:hypothetical protein